MTYQQTISRHETLIASGQSFTFNGTTYAVEDDGRVVIPPFADWAPIATDAVAAGLVTLEPRDYPGCEPGKLYPFLVDDAVAAADAREEETARANELWDARS